MEYAEFREAVAEHIRETEYDGARLRVKNYLEGYRPDDPLEEEIIRSANAQFFRKESGTMAGDILYIEPDLPEKKDSNVKSFSRVVTRSLYEKFQKSGWEGVDEEIRAYVASGIVGGMDVIEKLPDYPLVRDRLIIRPVPYRPNMAELNRCVYRRVGEIALTLYAVVKDGGGNLMTVKVPRVIRNQWGMDEEELYANTIRNTYFLAPPRIFLSPFEIEGASYGKGIFMGDSENRVKKLDRRIAPILTTTRRTNGAIAIFYPNVRERLGNMFGCDYYVALTSVHEAKLHAVGTASPRVIRNALRDTNRAFPETVLTNTLYYYSRERRRLEEVI